MELSDPRVLEDMLRLVSGAESKPERLTRPTKLVAKSAIYQTPAAKAQARRRCTCGACDRCVENARWERIFQEKFADPNYYARTLLRQDSSLGW